MRFPAIIARTIIAVTVFGACVADAQIKVDDEVLPLLNKIPTHDGLTVGDFMRLHQLKIEEAQAAPPDPEEHLQNGDYTILVVFDRTVNFDDMPCNLAHVAGGGKAEWIRRGRRYIPHPDAPLAIWLSTGRCPTGD